MAKKMLHALTTRSLLLQLRVNGMPLGNATGFIVDFRNRSFLISNLHVFSGRNVENGQPLSSTAGLPDEVIIFHHSTRRLGSWIQRSERLLDASGRELWLQHSPGTSVDVAALPLKVDKEIQIYPLDLRLADTDMIPEPAMPVSVIGFPDGLSRENSFPIWKTGHIASEPVIDHNGQPAFLIDATTRPGMSGSPVMLTLMGGYRTSQGMEIFGGTPETKWLGVYSGRITKDSEIGKVWRPRVVSELLAQSLGS